MYILTVEDSFSSAHQLRGYKGKCENIHGHNWKIVMCAKGKNLNNIGLLVDFHDLKKILKEIIGGLDHKNINEVKPFDEINPSSENLAKYICGKAQGMISEAYPDVMIESVTVWESDVSRCSYYPD